MKKILGIISSSIFILLLLLFNDVKAQTDLYVVDHHIDMVITEEGVYQMTHKLTVNFLTPYRGIYVTIPERYEMEWTLEDGSVEKRQYRFPIKNISAKNQSYSVERNSDGIVLTMADENQRYTGLKTYEYSYAITTRDLALGGRQRFYFNLLGSDWEMPTDEISFSVVFPKSIEDLDVFFYSGRYGTSSPANVTYSVDGNLLTGKTTSGLNDREALTVDIILPNDFFAFRRPFDFSVLSLFFSVGMLGLVMVLYMKHGKDDPTVVTVEFEPPKGLSSAQVGYVFDGVTDSKDVISLIIEWAQEGYLSIEELDKNNIQLNKLKEISSTKILAERTLFNDLFFGRESVTTKELEKKFYVSLNNAKSSITRHFTGSKQRKVFHVLSDVLQVLFGLFLPFTLGLLVMGIVYSNTYYLEEAVLTAAFPVGVGIFASIMVISYARKAHAIKKLAKFGLMISTLFAVFFASIVTVFMVWLYNGSQWKTMVVLLCYLIGLYFTSQMHKRTSQGVEWYGKILGLKNFIELAEKDRLEMLVHDDPEYFYKILPYAYVLNVTDTWSKKFENIAIEAPQWYVGPTPMNSYFFMRSLDRSLGRMTTSMTSVPQAKAGSGGGGFGGGGGFSGGGFGGGGGGGVR